MRGAFQARADGKIDKSAEDIFETVQEIIEILAAPTRSYRSRPSDVAGSLYWLDSAERTNGRPSAALGGRAAADLPPSRPAWR
jgi:hypothetical protein